LVQLRSKHATDARALGWARRIRELAEAHQALFFVNDRFDLALAAEADGVHLGQRDLTPRRLPREARHRLLVGYSTHTLEQIRASREEPIDYVAFGPIFASPTKASEPGPRGIALLTEGARLAQPRPLVAIGGITPGSVGEVVRAGARAVAVISALAAAADPEGSARELAEHIAKAESR
jgi:thiamine-phosphate pyrophosphorylase